MREREGGMRESTAYRRDTDKTRKVNAQVYCWKYYFQFLNRHGLQLMRRCRKYDEEKDEKNKRFLQKLQ